ncbi:MAG: A24 family peptidase [Thermodesulfobacteriota bacterium]
MTPADLAPWLGGNASLLLPLLLSIWMAWGDIRTQRIPNYLTLGTAMAGLGFQLGFHGWAGLWSGFLGLALGFGLLILPYLLRGLGAGDVKAMAALGAWLGPGHTFFLFVYMGICGGLLILLVLGWRGTLWSYLRQVWNCLIRLVRRRATGTATAGDRLPQQKIPYAVAMALGMAVLYWHGLKY